MPQVDLETLVSACAGGSCSDRKIACETLAGEDNTTSSSTHILHPGDEDSDRDQPAVPPDFPPESFCLSRDAELDWLDRNAFFERKGSAKGTDSTTANLNPPPNPSSHRFNLNFNLSFKSKGSILGLPKPQSSSFSHSKSRRSSKPGRNIRFFPKRSGSAAKPDAPANEPSSPKVSCMGRVRSKKDRNRRLQNRQQSSAESEAERPKPPGKRKTGFFASFQAMFRTGRKQKQAREDNAPPMHTSSLQNATLDAHDIRNRLAECEIDAPPRKSVTGGEPPGLGGMQRMASGRRSGSWVTGDPESELARFDTLDRDSVRRR